MWTNLFIPFKDLQVLFRLLGHLIETILSFVTKKNAGAGGIMLLENPLGLHLHQKGTENGKQWVIHRESPAACLAVKFPANVRVRVFVCPCESLSVCHTSCVFRKYWDFCLVGCYFCYLALHQVEQSLWKKHSQYCRNWKPYFVSNFEVFLPYLMQMVHSIDHKLTEWHICSA